MPAPKRRTTRRRTAARGPKRILNCKPSAKTEEDFTFEHAAETAAVAEGADDPAEQGPARGVVEDQRPGVDGVVRGVGDRRRAPALALRPGRADQEHRAAVAALHLDGVQGDRPVHHPADGVHRHRGHEPEVGARRRPQVRRRARRGAALRLGRAVRGRLEDVLRARIAAEDPHLLQPRHDAGQLEDVAGDQGPDPHAPGRRRDVGRLDRQQGQHGRVPARHHPRRALRRPRRLSQGPLHRAQQLGHRLGRQGLRLRVAGLRAGGLHRGLRHPGLPTAGA